MDHGARRIWFLTAEPETQPKDSLVRPSQLRPSGADDQEEDQDIGMADAEEGAQDSGQEQISDSMGGLGREVATESRAVIGDQEGEEARQPAMIKSPITPSRQEENSMSLPTHRIEIGARIACGMRASRRRIRKGRNERRKRSR